MSNILSELSKMKSDYAQYKHDKLESISKLSLEIDEVKDALRALTSKTDFIITIMTNASDSESQPLLGKKK
jgi:phosphoglycolate phosphatase-like HAD superfamily hydrolase